MKLTMLIFTMALSLSSFAASHQVLQVVNDNDSRVVTVSLETNDAGDFVSLRQITTQGKSLVSDFNINETKGRKGISLCSEGDIEVIRLKILDRFEPIHGGPFKLDYLYNGIKGSRRSVELEAVREGNKWVIQFDGKTVKRANVVSNKVFGKVIGVSQIKF
jgi:hypothetical protein